MMRTAIRNVIVAGVALIAALDGTTEAQQNSFTAFGSTDRWRCSQFVQIADSERKVKTQRGEDTVQYALFVSFAQGFLSGVNWSTLGHVGPHGDFASAMDWLENYCRGNPSDLYVNAVIRLRIALAEKGQK